MLVFGIIVLIAGVALFVISILLCLGFISSGVVAIAMKSESVIYLPLILLFVPLIISIVFCIILSKNITDHCLASFHYLGYFRGKRFSDKAGKTYMKSDY